MKTAYQILGVDRTATDAQVRTAFREKSKTAHPDKEKNPDKIKHAEKAYDELKKAYDLLKDASKRAAYDDELTTKELRRRGASVPDEPIDQGLHQWYTGPQHQHKPFGGRGNPGRVYVVKYDY